MNTIGKRIRAVRLAKGCTQRQIAQQLHITVPAYSKIELGLTDINLSRLAQIAGVFKLTLAELVSFGNAPGQSEADTEHQLAQLEKEADRLQKKVIELYGQLQISKAAK